MTDPDQAQFPAAAPVVGQPAADVHAPQVGEGNQVTYTYPIRQPEEDFNDFQVGVRASLLKRCRGRLQTVATQGFPLPELLLGVSTLTAGAALSAVISGVQLGSWRGVVFFVILPMIAVGSGVAYGMLRRFGLRATQHLAEDILNDLPDPDRSIEVRSR
jgi:hypothetical protein